RLSLTQSTRRVELGNQPRVRSDTGPRICDNRIRDRRCCCRVPNLARDRIAQASRVFELESPIGTGRVNGPQERVRLLRRPQLGLSVSKPELVLRIRHCLVMNYCSKILVTPLRLVPSALHVAIGYRHERAEAHACLLQRVLYPLAGSES